MTFELLHDHLRATLGAAGVKDLPPTMRVPRPYEVSAEPPADEGLTLDDWRAFLEG